MAFKADAVVEALEYDFNPYPGKGTTPEPSDKAVRHFLFTTQQIAAQLPDSDKPDFLELMNNITEEDWEMISDQVIDAVAELTNGQPTREEIEGLPHRIQQKYISWLRKELTDPEAPSSVTKPSLGVVRGGKRITTSESI